MLVSNRPSFYLPFVSLNEDIILILRRKDALELSLQFSYDAVNLRDHMINLVSRDAQRGRQIDGIAGPAEQVVLIHQGCHLVRELRLGREGLFGVSVLHKFHRTEQSHPAAHIANDRVLVQRLKLFIHVCAHFRGVLHHAFAFHNVQVGEGCGAGNRIAAEGNQVTELRVVAP